jgi:hypothetical protein
VNRRTDNTIAKRKRTNNDLQNITHKIKDRVTRIVEVFFIIVQGETMNRKIIVLLLQYLEEDK